MKPHRTDGVSLSFGLIFLLVAAWWAASQVVTLQLPALGWVIAGMLILFGTIGLLGAIRSGRRTGEPAPVPAEASVSVPGDLPPEMHADIVRELLDDPAARFTREHPAADRTSAPAPATWTPASDPASRRPTSDPATWPTPPGSPARPD